MTAPYGWCPSVLRPMPLADGLMVRIRPWLGYLSREQAADLAELAGRFGAGHIELTNRANIQLRGLSEDDYAALLPLLDRLDLTRVDRTPSARVNVAIEPIRDQDSSTQALAEALSGALSEVEFAGLPEKFGFVIDPGGQRVMDGIAGDIRIEGSGTGLIVRAAGNATGCLVSSPDDAVSLACDLARAFIGSGAIGDDRRGRMASAIEAGWLVPADLFGEAHPNPPGKLDFSTPEWLAAPEGKLDPAVLLDASLDGPFRMTPFRSLYVPSRTGRSHLVSPRSSGNIAQQSAATTADPT